MKRVFNPKLAKTLHNNVASNFVLEIILTLAIMLGSILFPLLSSAQKGKDGVYSFSPGSVTTAIVNRYSVLASGVSSGASSITVANIADLSGSTSFTNSVNAFSTAALSPGDLVMITQMQGASINITDALVYGTITSYNNTGNYELRTVLSIATNTITFCQALTNSYTVGGTARAQVIRIPRFSTATVGLNGILSAMPWAGTIGGVCAIEVNGNLIVNGKIDATGTGFRGGTANNGVGNFGSAGYRTSNSANGGLKGEGIAGNQSDYAGLNGEFGRGAAANGGGGGDSHNSGGGGGANAGRNGTLTWNGTGVKSTTVASWATAWNLEVAGFAIDTSRGGGRGGYSYASGNGNAITQGPGDAVWSGDLRRNVGGLGGRPLDYSANTRLFMGGGGGAGDENGGVGGSGGNGGGILYLLVAGTVSGTGNITSNGNNGVTAGSLLDVDGAGGGGAGGSVILLSNSNITGIAINANGGAGGNEIYTSSSSAGLGGGGGGGYIYTTLTSVTRSVVGGTNGLTNSSSLTEFLPNGSTMGDAGTILNNATYTEVNSCFKEINSIGSPSCSYSASTVSTANTILNSYYPGTGSVAAGSSKVSVGAIRTGGAITKISPGDLLLIMQIQGSTINSTNTSAYGSGTTSYNGYLTSVAGNYEYVYAASGVVNGIIYLATPLRKSYTSSPYTAGVVGQYTFQIIRVPEYSTLTINSGSSVTAVSWDGSTGGVVALNVKGNLSLGTGTTIDVSGKGFRGGGGRISSGDGSIVALTSSVNSSMGEGIAGTPRFVFDGSTTIDNTIEGYPNGSTGIGAPANAGGGNSSNGDGGAGGGGNAGVGGRGGRAYSTPGTDNGGYGGATFALASTTKIILGGGGGAGSTNNGTGSLGAATSSGAAGGGMILINTASISGTSTFNANGNDGLNPLNDGAGGGGAGGSVYVYSTAPAGLANITINAKGGKGGDAWPTQADDGTANNGNPEHGPGGGGGGGFVYTNGSINGSSSLVGGLAGITTTSNYNYFATAGTSGVSSTAATAPKVPVKVYCDIDDDNDGITDVNENPYGVDPFLDADNDGVPNMCDSTSGTLWKWKDSNHDQINDTLDVDLDGKINELDIDSDNDGITDNVEAQSTSSYKVPSDVDTDADGLNDLYELPAQIGTTAGNGLTPVDTDSDGIPDYLDTDSDNDTAPDRNEGDRNAPFITITQATIDASGDADGDGLMDIFDNLNSDTSTVNYYKNVTMSQMGPLGDFNGPVTSGSKIQLQQSDPLADRDWRNVSILPLQITNLTVNYQSPIAMLKWDVVNEFQTNYYEVEVSTNGRDFDYLAKVAARNGGKVTYTYPHSINSQKSTVYYYRIRQVDRDGKSYLSKIVVVRLEKNVQVNVSPNPFMSSINVVYNSDIAKTVTLTIVSTDGKTVASQQTNVSKGINSIQFANLNNLSNGVYYLKIQTPNSLETIKLLKN